MMTQRTKDQPTAEEKHPEKVLECTECGKTVLITRNPVTPDKYKDRVYCTCDPVGIPMTPLELEEDDEEPDEPQPIEASGPMFERWDDLTPDDLSPGAWRVICLDCGFRREYEDHAGMTAKQSAMSARSGHLNRGCEHTYLITHQPPEVDVDA